MIALIEFFASLTVLTSAFGQLERLEFLHGRVNVYLFELPLVLTLVLLIAVYRAKPWQSLLGMDLASATKQLLVYLVLVGLATMMIFPLVANVVAWLYLARLAVYLLFIVYLFYFCRIVEARKGWLRRSVIGYLVIAIVSAPVQYFYYPDLRNLFYDGWDPHYYRLFGLYFEPVYAAAVYGLLLIYFATSERLPKWLRWAGEAVFLVLVTVTFSRAAWVALLVTALVYAARQKHIRLVLVGLAVVAGVFFLIPRPSGEGVNILRTSTIISRTTDYQEGLRLWGTSPIFGIGYNHIPALKQTPQQASDMPNHAEGSFHSSFLILLVTGGVIGLLLFMNWLFQLAQVSEFMKYAVVFLVVASFFDNVLLHPFVLVLVAVLGGMGISRLSSTSA